ncbi:MAG: VWA domain-containing protein [Acidobacteriota bacterium]|nr:VWA domain-containing protein [Blastocatellia bacterium]MDW8240428.1 VWA domain-containing protein [Acidobacteriota bacterium]
MKKFSCWLTLVILILCQGSSVAQSGRHRRESPPPSTAASESDEAVRLSTTEVVVPVTVRNRYGRPIQGLTKSDFILYEDGRRQELTGFYADSVAAHIVMLIDVSGSVQTEIDNIRLAALSVITQLRPNDRVCIYQFNDTVRLLEDWTSDKLRLERALMNLPATGNTAFYNALYEAALKLSQIDGRRTILLLTDGVDTYQGKHPKSAAEAFEAIQRAEASVYVISKTKALREYLRGIRSPSIFRALDPRDLQIQWLLQALDESERWLISLAERTGGKIYFPVSQYDLTSVYNDIAQELNAQYVLHYVPQNLNFDGRFRRIRVETSNPAYIAYAREGYYAVRR